MDLSQCRAARNRAFDATDEAGHLRRDAVDWTKQVKRHASGTEIGAERRIVRIGVQCLLNAAGRDIILTALNRLRLAIGAVDVEVDVLRYVPGRTRLEVEDVRLELINAGTHFDG